MASMDVNEAPETALANAWRMAQVVNTLVGRPMQVAIVNGLNKNLGMSIMILLELEHNSRSCNRKTAPSLVLPWRCE